MQSATVTPAKNQSMAGLFLKKNMCSWREGAFVNTEAHKCKIFLVFKTFSPEKFRGEARPYYLSEYIVILLVEGLYVTGCYRGKQQYFSLFELE